MRRLSSIGTSWVLRSTSCMESRPFTVPSVATKCLFTFEFCINQRWLQVPENRSNCFLLLAVANVKGLFAEYEARNVPFVRRLKKEPWGQSSFIVRDPDGNWLCFAG